MWIALACALADAQEPAPEREGLYRANRTYRTGVALGIAGVAGIVGTTVGVGLHAEATGTNVFAYDGTWPLLLGGILAGAVALEVGAPVAMTGARREHQELGVGALRSPTWRHGTPLVTAGWVCYAGQFLLPVGLPLSYGFAWGQHGVNTRLLREAPPL
jgi:hypothetical protein